MVLKFGKVINDLTGKALPDTTQTLAKLLATQIANNDVKSNVLKFFEWSITLNSDPKGELTLSDTQDLKLLEAFVTNLQLQTYLKGQLLTIISNAK